MGALSSGGSEKGRILIPFSAAFRLLFRRVGSPAYIYTFVGPIEMVADASVY